MGQLATCYLSTGRPGEAVKLFKESLAIKKAELGPEHPDTLHSMSGLAGSYFVLGHMEEALRIWEELIALEMTVLGGEHPDTIDTMQNAAMAYRELGRDADGEKLLQKAMKLRGSSIPNHPYRRFALEPPADREKHEERFDDAMRIEREVNDPRRLMVLAWLMATAPSNKDRDIVRAIELATKACELTDYNSMAPLGTLAAIYAEAGDFDAAVKWSEKAVRLIDDTTDPESRERMRRALESYRDKKPYRHHTGTPSN
jgi:tetratricopeptide (TPR) repeat protein